MDHNVLPIGFESAGQHDICIAVATHKPYRMPADSMYLPLHVGAALHPEVLPDMVGDNTGDNISSLNSTYCELTGLYWMWKNCNAKYKGLVHYRRHFATADMWSCIKTSDRFRCVVSCEELRRLLNKTPIVLPRRRNYFIETIYSHYAHTLPVDQLDLTRLIIAQYKPDYLFAFDEVMKSTRAHMFNMMVMRSDLFDAYCAWLFPVLSLLTERLDPSQYDAFNARYPGRVSELLLDTWLITQKLEYRELPTVSPEPVNWTKKGTAFLMAKFTGKKYGASF